MCKVLVPLEEQFYVHYRVQSLHSESLRVFREMDFIKGGIDALKAVKDVKYCKKNVIY